MADEELNVTLPALQNVVALPAVIVGAVGIGFTVTIIAFDADDKHPLLVTIHV
jgi:hypothetical protein